MINIIYTVLCILCLCVGFFVGYNISKESKKINNQVTIKNPKEKIKNIVKTKKNDKKLEEQLEELNKIYDNIENYDGTSKNQKELKNVKIGIL